MRTTWIWALAFSFLFEAVGTAQVTQRLSLDSAGNQGNEQSYLHKNVDRSISADGRFVAFWSVASDLVDGDTNGAPDVFVRDRETGTTERVSVDSTGAQGNGSSLDPSISADGRYVAFESAATNLVPGDTNHVFDIFVFDRMTRTIERVSVDSAGVESSNQSFYASISADGRYVAFESIGDNLVAGDTNASWDVFLRDRQNGTTERVSVDSSAAQGNGDSLSPSISADGRRVAFESSATNLVADDLNGNTDIFLRDIEKGTTERVSVDSRGAEANGNSAFASLSGDGRTIAFESSATNLVEGDTNEHLDVFVHDRQSGATERVSVNSGAVQGDDDSSNPSISFDGRYVAFTSSAAHLVLGDTNGTPDIFLRDRLSGTTERVSTDSSGLQGDGQSSIASISADGRYVAYASNASNLVPGDTNGFWDVFLRDRIGGTNFTSVCEPGVGDVMNCPCANAPSGPSRGCDNSAGTGGAILSASGSTSLSSDSLVFSTNGQRPGGLSIVMQGNALVAGGHAFGQGVGCVGGTIIRRLYIKVASAGGITAPNLGAGDPPVSMRSAAKGDTIRAGESRWYLVYYRDPIVSGSCSKLLKYSATQTGAISWTP